MVLHPDSTSDSIAEGSCASGNSKKRKFVWHREQKVGEGSWKDNSPVGESTSYMHVLILMRKRLH